MAYVITELCVGVKDKACLPVCPCDCIYEGELQLYIEPECCIDCGACEPACPVGAIFWDKEVPEKHLASIHENADFFKNRLPGSSEPARPQGSSSSDGSLKLNGTTGTGGGAGRSISDSPTGGGPK